MLVEGIKLNLGCGHDLRKGWINIDVKSWVGADVVSDIRDLDYDKFSDMDMVFANQVFQYLSYRDVARVLDSICKNAHEGTVIWISVPDFKQRVDRYSNRRRSLEQINYDIFGGQQKEDRPEYLVNRSVWDMELLERTLRNAGFQTVEQIQTDEMYHEWGIEIAAVKGAGKREKIWNLQENLEINGWLTTI